DPLPDALTEELAGCSSGGGRSPAASRANFELLHAAWHRRGIREQLVRTDRLTGKGNLLRGCDVLIAKEDDAMIIVGALDSGEHLVVDGSGQVDTANLGAERGTRRNNLD